MRHDLKTWPEYFQDVLMGKKRFEVRKNDRKYKVGDHLNLKEWDPESKEYTGTRVLCSVDYILNGGNFGVDPEYVVMSITLIYRPN